MYNELKVKCLKLFKSEAVIYMGLTPKQPLNNQLKNWSDLDKKLKYFIQSSGDVTIINIEDYHYPKKQIIVELEKNNYRVEDSGGKYIYAIG